MNRINLYLFRQILNSCTLVFFIFVSIAWLLQLSRIFSVMNNLQVNTLEILQLSLLIIPNLINVTIPFVFTFGIVLAFIKFSKDKELIAIYSLGLSINEIKKPIYAIILIFSIVSIFLSFFFSPKSYSIYKEKEFNLRNSIEFDKINISNFIKFNENLTIDFENDNGIFKNILININEENEVIIYADNGQIEQDDKKLTFKLNYGFKTEIKDNNVEILKFDSYISDFPIKNIKKYDKFDPNTLNIFELFEKNDQRSHTIINHRLIDTLILISICLFFYFYIIRKNQYELKYLISFIIASIICFTFDNLLENFTHKNPNFIILSFLNIFFIHLLLIDLLKKSKV